MKKYVKSPIFYMGNKYKLLPQLIALFPNDIDNFYDLFGGSGCMVNVNCNNYVYNEINENIYKLFSMFTTVPPKTIITSIKNTISKFDLNKEGTNVRQNNPNIKKVRDYYNKNYLAFREYYNSSKERLYIDLYTLTFYSFSNLIRFNKNNEFNMPYGNRCFCKKHEDNILEWCSLLKNKKIEINNKDAFDILQDKIFSDKDFIYLDPPYTNTLAIYNEKSVFGGWDKNQDLRLFFILEKLDKCGVRWGMSNVFENKNIKNEHLIKWCKDNKWIVYHLNKNYSALGKGNANSDEVYICNYELEKE